MYRADRHRTGNFAGLGLELLESRTLLSRADAIAGDVQAGGHAFSNATVTLYETGAKGATALGSSQTDAVGRYNIPFKKADRGAQLYLIAAGNKPANQSLVYLAVAGQVGSSLNRNVAINEYTTVSSAYALSQFIHGAKIYGQSPGIDNAAATTFNLVNAPTGSAASVVSNSNNGVSIDPAKPSTLALQTIDTLADVLAAGATNNSNLASLFGLTTINGVAPTDTLAAMLNIVHNPAALNNAALFGLAQSQTTYAPTLAAAPNAWLVALHYTDGGFSAPGRIDFDTLGNVWSNNNFNPPAGVSTDPGQQITVLSPTGNPIFGSPIVGNGVYGSGYGIAIAPDGTIWIGNFSDNTLSVFSKDGKPIRNIAQNFGNLDHPMGMAFDADGNLWICNMGDFNDPNDFGSITVYPRGDFRHAINFTHDDLNPLQLVHKPFNVAVDQQGRAWVVNSSLAPVGSVMVLKLDKGKIRLVKSVDVPASGDDTGLPAPNDQFGSPKTIAIDNNGNAWLADFEDNHLVTFINATTFTASTIAVEPEYHGWGLAVDGNDRVWTSSFSNDIQTELSTPPSISVLQANSTGGTYLYSFSNPALQHVTAVQLDASGNVWAVNNWALSSTASTIVGGDGLVEFLGQATPVSTPLVTQRAGSAKHPISRINARNTQPFSQQFVPARQIKAAVTKSSCLELWFPWSIFLQHDVEDRQQLAAWTE